MHIFSHFRCYTKVLSEAGLNLSRKCLMVLIRRSLWTSQGVAQMVRRSRVQKGTSDEQLEALPDMSKLQKDQKCTCFLDVFLGWNGSRQLLQPFGWPLRNPGEFPSREATGHCVDSQSPRKKWLGGGVCPLTGSFLLGSVYFGRL